MRRWWTWDFSRVPRWWRRRWTGRRRTLRIDDWNIRTGRTRRRQCWWLPFLKDAVARQKRRASELLRNVRGFFPRGIASSKWVNAPNKVYYWRFLVDHVLDLHAPRDRLRRRVTVRKLNSQVLCDCPAMMQLRLGKRTLARACRAVSYRQKGSWRRRRRRRNRKRRRNRWSTRRAQGRAIRADRSVVTFSIRDIAPRTEVADVRVLTLVRHRLIGFACLHLGPKLSAIRATAKHEQRASPRGPRSVERARMLQGRQAYSVP